MDYLECLKEINKIQKNENNKKINIAILRSYSAENIKIPLQAILHKERIDANIIFGGFNQYYQEIMDESSFLYEENIDIALILLKNEDIIYKDINCSEIAEYYNKIIKQLKWKTNVRIIIISNFDEYNREYNICEYRNPESEINKIKKINYDLMKIASEFNNVFILDINRIVRNLGEKNVYDYRMKYMYENPYKVEVYIEMAEYINRIINAVYYKTKKVIAVDMDNTLYNGILGEDGRENISIYDSYPNNCYRTIQEKLIQLKNFGFLIVILSKNNEKDVDDFFSNNKNIILKKEDIVRIKANWDEKWKNLIEVAKELNVGIDSFIFIDDNEYEIDLMNKNLPEVETVLIPKKRYEIDETLNKLKQIDKLNVTQEDKDKTSMYHAIVKKDNGLEDFLKELNMTVKIKRKNNLSKSEIERVSEMTLKTNQFNMTTKRYTLTDIEKMVSDDSYEILLLSEEDKYGSQGNVGLAILKTTDTSILIDTFLLSCRVLKRNIEYVLFDNIIEYSKEKKKTKVQAMFIETDKNKAFQDFYKNAGMKNECENNYELYINDYKCKPFYYIKLGE